MSKTIIHRLTEGLGTLEHPNEPASMTQVTERQWSAFDEDGWGHVDDANYTIETNVSGAPKSAPDVGQAFMPGGGTGGGSFGTNCWKTNMADTVAYKHIYMHFWHRVSSNWQGHDSGVNKIFFVVDPPTASRPVILNWTQIDFGAARPQVRVQGDFAANWAWDQCDEITDDSGDPIQCTSGITAEGAELTPGTWHEWEVYLAANTGTDNNGTIKLWIDGTLILEYDGTAQFWSSTAESDRVWDQIKHDPVWGGTGDTLLEDQFHQLDHIYASMKE